MRILNAKAGMTGNSILATAPMPCRSAPILSVMAGKLKQHHQIQDSFRIMLPQSTCQSLPGHYTYSCAHLLYRRHERKGNQSRPQGTITKARTGLRVGSNA